MNGPAAHPARALSTVDAVFVVVGIVVGAGIFAVPSLVAANSADGITVLLLWLAGGAVAFIGALCYAELASTYPSTGGDYHFLNRAFGRNTAFLFAWARLAVMQTGSIALLSFIFGDYVAQVLPIGPYSSAIYAAAIIVALTAVNLMGLREGKNTQSLLAILEIGGVLAIAVAGLLFFDPDSAGQAASGAAESGQPVTNSMSTIGLAMVFVLLTYGGWNEGAYVSAEMKGGPRAIVRVLLLSIVIITALYVLVNLAFLNVLGREGMAASEAVAADAMRLVGGETGAALVSLLVAISALSSINATIITGARCNHALGRDFVFWRFLGTWNTDKSTPASGLLIQGVIALLLVLLGAATRSGFQTLVEYTAPVFWFFFLLTGIALFRLRHMDPQATRPFRVPLYPVTPVIFCASSAYILWSSLNYTGRGALIGVAVLLAGLPLLWFMHRSEAANRLKGETHASADHGARSARGLAD